VVAASHTGPEANLVTEPNETYREEASCRVGVVEEGVSFRAEAPSFLEEEAEPFPVVKTYQEVVPFPVEDDDSDTEEDGSTTWWCCICIIELFSERSSIVVSVIPVW
jgi:hypothetical protein